MKKILLSRATRITPWRNRFGSYFDRLVPPMVLMVALVILGPVTACGGDESDVVGMWGRSLELYSSRPLITDKVSFVDDEGQYRVIRASASNRQLVVLDVTIANRTSTIVPMMVDAEDAALGDRRGERINALDPFESSKPEETPDPPDLEVDRYSPFLWGEIQLERNFQVGGWMVFDVPKGLTLGTIFWRDVDTITLDFIDYWPDRD